MKERKVNPAVYGIDENYIIKDSPVSIKRYFEGPTEWHQHLFWEFVLVTSGAGEHKTESGIQSIGDKTIIVIPPNIPHAYLTEKPFNIINVLVKEEFIRENKIPVDVSEIKHAVINSVDFQELQDLIPKIELEVVVRNKMFKNMLAGLTQQVVVDFIRLLDTSKDNEDDSLTRIAKALTYLDSKYYQNISIEELAEIVNMSQRNFIRHFKTATGTTPKQYLLDLRMKHAVRMFRENRMNVTEVALSCGFHDSNHFSNTFKRITGITPGEMLKKSRN